MCSNYAHFILIAVVVVSFIEKQYSVSEAEGVMTVGIELDKPSPQRIVLQLVITPITAQGNVLFIRVSLQ